MFNHARVVKLCCETDHTSILNHSDTIIIMLIITAIEIAMPEVNSCQCAGTKGYTLEGRLLVLHGVDKVITQQLPLWLYPHL